jgi:hypothetical protein
MALPGLATQLGTGHGRDPEASVGSRRWLKPLDINLKESWPLC